MANFLRKPIFFVFISFLTNCSYAQNNISTLNLLSKPQDKSIILRWLPENVKTWELGRQYGYNLSRKTYMRNGMKLRNPEVKTLLVNSKPKPKSFWEKKTDVYGVAIAQTFFSSPPVSKEEQENSQKYLFFISLLSSNMSASVAEGLALRYTDSTVFVNEKYEYILTYGNPANTLNSVSIFASLDMKYTLASPKITAHSFIDSTTTIHFNAKDFSAYNLYRSDNNGVSFHKINEAPLVPTFSDPYNDVYSMTDTVNVLYKNYHYRLVGIDPFADESSPSQTIKVYAYYTELPMPKNTSFLPTKDGKLVLFWTYPDTLRNNLKGFKVIKTANLEDISGVDLHSKLLSNTAKRFVDAKPESESIYRILAVDLANREISSPPIIVQLDDTIAPAKPQNLKGKISQKGIVTISWTPNIEKDLYGYRIYMANSKNENFSLINTDIKKDTLYTDTVSLSLLNKYIYYQIVPIDNHLNPAQFVDTLQLKRPDVISPIAPAISQFTISDTLVYLKWSNSPSEDVVLHRLSRETSPDTNRTILKEWDNNSIITSWNDTTINEGINYCYFIEAIDDSGNSSEKSCSLPIKTPVPYIRPAIKNWKGAFVKDDAAIVLGWPISFKQKVNYFTLFKRIGNNDLKPYKRLNSEISEFKDLDWNASTTYGYVIVANFDDETLSQMSNELVIKTPDRKR